MKTSITLLLAAGMIAATLYETPLYSQGKRMAVTALSENLLRAEADYDSPLETQTLMGTVVEILNEEGYWRQVHTSEPYTAWCTELGLVEMSEEEIEAYKAAPKYICVAHHSCVHEKPSFSSRRLSDLSLGGLVRIVHKADKGRKGTSPGKMSRKKKWAEVMLPDGRKGWVPERDVKVFSRWIESRRLTPQAILDTASDLEGVPYIWGGTSSKGMDCSGLTRLTFFMNGLLIPRNASQQAGYGREVIVECNHKTSPESAGFREEMLKRIQHLQPGDLIFFGTPETAIKKAKVTHVGIYIGKGRFIHSSQVVRTNSLIPGERDYYGNSYRLIMARRFFDWQGPGVTPMIQSPAYFPW